MPDNKEYMAILCRCANKECNHVFVEDEMGKIAVGSGYVGHTQYVCPSCSNDAYFLVNNKGLKSRDNKWVKMTIDMRAVSPSRRLSRAVQQSVIDARDRFLGRMEEAKEHEN